VNDELILCVIKVIKLVYMRVGVRVCVRVCTLVFVCVCASE